jgi:hypothetical protein
MRLSGLVAVFAACFALALAGCGGGDKEAAGTPAVGATPQETVEAFVAGMTNKDPQAVWNLMGSKAIAKADEDLAKLKKDEDGMTEMAIGILGIGKDELATMNSEQFFVRSAKAIFGMMEEMEKEGMGNQMDFEIGEMKMDGDHATVPVTNKAQNKTKEMLLIKEGGVWRFDANPMGK